MVFRISIHAPRVRCDNKVLIVAPKKVAISIHAPRVRCDKVMTTAEAAEL